MEYVSCSFTSKLEQAPLPRDTIEMNVLIGLALFASKLKFTFARHIFVCGQYEDCLIGIHSSAFHSSMSALISYIERPRSRDVVIVGTIIQRKSTFMLKKDL